MEAIIQYQYRPDKKEPYGAMLRRIHDAIAATGSPDSFEFAFTDSPIPGGTSPVERAVKKLPMLSGLVQEYSGNKMIRGTQSDLAFAAVAQVADGMPRSLPFHGAVVKFHGPSRLEVVANDNWWVNGRQRGLAAQFVLDADEKDRKLPEPEGALGGILAALGKPSKKLRVPMTVTEPAPAELRALAQKFRSMTGEFVAGAGMPHTLAPRTEVLRLPSAFEPHPLKPTLEHHFRPLGYSCKGGSGTFTLRHRTPANHIAEVYLDVGTWSRSVTAIFHLYTPVQRFTVLMPVAPGLDSGQYPIGSAENWDKIVANLAALTAHLERKIVPEVEAATDPAPEWFEPQS